MGRTWNNVQHLSKGPMNVNYYCYPTPPSPSPFLHKELPSLIKFIIYFLYLSLPPRSHNQDFSSMSTDPYYHIAILFQ